MTRLDTSLRCVVQPEVQLLHPERWHLPFRGLWHRRAVLIARRYVTLARPQVPTQRRAITLCGVDADPWQPSLGGTD